MAIAAAARIRVHWAAHSSPRRWRSPRPPIRPPIINSAIALPRVIRPVRALWAHCSAATAAHWPHRRPPLCDHRRHCHRRRHRDLISNPRNRPCLPRPRHPRLCSFLSIIAPRPLPAHAPCRRGPCRRRIMRPRPHYRHLHRHHRRHRCHHCADQAAPSRPPRRHSHRHCHHRRRRTNACNDRRPCR